MIQGLINMYRYLSDYRVVCLHAGYFSHELARYSTEQDSFQYPWKIVPAMSQQNALQRLCLL